jgi:uncharacterized protein with ATP-grasp and redox domains
MFMQKQCEECFFNQLPDLFDLYEVKDCDRERLTGIVKAIVCDPENRRISPPETAEKVYEALTLETGVDDPYADIKRANNKEMTDLYPLPQTEDMGIAHPDTDGVEVCDAGEFH